MRVLLPVLYVLFAYIGIAGMASIASRSDRRALLFFVPWIIGVAVQAWWTLLRVPWRIEANEQEVRFLARSRVVTIPWAQLRSVTSPWYDLNREFLRWEWDGGRLRTLGRWDDQRRLLTAVEERAPGVVIKGV